MLPGFRTAEHIVDFFPLEVHLLLEGLVDDEDVRAGLAEESEIGRRLLRQQQVRTSRAEQHSLINTITKTMCISTSLIQSS